MVQQKWFIKSISVSIILFCHSVLSWELVSDSLSGHTNWSFCVRGRNNFQVSEMVPVLVLLL